MKFRVGDEVISRARVAKGQRGIVCHIFGDTRVSVKFPNRFGTLVTKQTKNIKHAHPAYLRMDTGL